MSGNITGNVVKNVVGRQSRPPKANTGCRSNIWSHRLMTTLPITAEKLIPNNKHEHFFHKFCKIVCSKKKNRRRTYQARNFRRKPVFPVHHSGRWLIALKCPRPTLRYYITSPDRNIFKMGEKKTFFCVFHIIRNCIQL